ncbi:hypothetical protein VpasPP24_85 [Vibrio phage Vpas_PP24]|nr:hypothetical protein VpasPP24_85 [Vibrio phage Vpas_PP24]
MGIKKGAAKFFGQALADNPVSIDVDAPKKKQLKKSPLMKFADKAESLHISTDFCLISELQQTMSGHDPDRPYHRLHASDVTNQDIEFCPRERGLLIATKAEPNSRYISTETRTYFDIGEAYHDLVREKWGLKVSLGNWLCLGCNHLHVSVKKPNGCSKCGNVNLKYDELRVKSETTSISCGIDWQIASPKLSLPMAIEIKSIAPDEFKKLVAPHAEHRIRTKLYLYALNDATNPPTVQHLNKDQAGVLYVSKGAGYGESYLGGSGFKEKKTVFKLYMVERDDAEIEYYLEKGRSLKKFLEGGILPERICKTPQEKRAKACSMCKQCWNKT